MKRVFQGALLALFATVALAAGPTNTLTITPATTNTDGSAITGTSTYNVYEGATATTLSTTPILAAITLSAGNTVVVPGVGGTTTCFAVVQIVGGQDSAQSNVSCKTFPASVPNAPNVVDN